jgi:DNA-binding CsgD family transcriptional regulator
MSAADELLSALEHHDLIRFRVKFEEQYRSVVDRLSQFLRAPLTERERLVCYLTYLGESMSSIASYLCISIHTVRTHSKQILRKLADSAQKHCWLRTALLEITVA